MPLADKGPRFGKRHVLSFLAFLGFANVYAMRVNMSVALVAMVNNSAIDPPHPSSNASNTCPYPMSTCNLASWKFLLVPCQPCYYRFRPDQPQHPERGRPVRLGPRAAGHHFGRLLLGLRFNSDPGRRAGGALRRETRLRPRHPRHFGLHHPDASGGARRLRFAHHLQVA